jgi:predicted CXXCH cytochrome family protein
MSGNNEWPHILQTKVSGGRKMKKILALLLVGALLATPAFAVIRNSKHDLSSDSTATVRSNNVDETCVFCHTPHGGSTATLAPLWNRSIPGGGFVAGDLYNSATLDQTNSNPTNVLTAVNNSDAPLCMSCHDGGTLVGGLTNPSNNSAQPAGAALASVTGFMNIDDSTTGLTNDHPIGMNYVAVQAADSAGFKAGTAAGVGPSDVLPLYTSTFGTSVMWCSSCHDVHDQGSGQPFLNMDNAGSALCTTCHIK